MNIRRVGIGTIFLLLVAGTLALASCFSPLTGEGNEGRFVVGVGGSSSRAFSPTPENIAALTLEITVSGGPGPDQTKISTGDSSVPFTVIPGTWTISVRAYDNGVIAAYGSRNATIQAGNNSVVEIVMNIIRAGLYRVDGEAYIREDIQEGVDHYLTNAVTHVNTNNGTYMLFMEPNTAIFGGGLVPVPTAQTLGVGEHLTLVGITPTQLQISGFAGALFTVNAGASLTLDSDITLRGTISNITPVVQVNGTFTMRGGAITANTNNSSITGGGGVFVDGGIFIMNGGTIFGNKATQGGGVYIRGGNFSKTGGIILGNPAVNPANQNSATDGNGNGHAVYMDVDGTNYKFRDNEAFVGKNSTDADFWEGPGPVYTTYTVTFDANGGTGGPPPITGISYNGTISPPTPPTREGYTFGGWYKDDPSIRWIFDTNRVIDNITLYARWNPVTYNVGDIGPGGGKIFYVSPGGFTVEGIGICHYLEAAPADLPGGAFMLMATNIHVVTSDAIGAGKANTTATFALETDPYSFAIKEWNTYNNATAPKDWFIPSKNELVELYNQKTMLGMEGFYWSSTENSGNPTEAWMLNFAIPLSNTLPLNPNANTKYSTTITNAVRLIRAF